MKKAILFILVFFIIGKILFSQTDKKVKNLPKYDKQLLRFGFTIGLSTADFYIRNSNDFFDTSKIDTVYSIENKRQPGFQLGPVSNLRLGKYFDFRFLVNLTFIQRDLTYKIVKDTSGSDLIFDNVVMKLSSTFIEFPMLLKYKAKRINNYRPYVITGINPKLDLASKRKIADDEIKIRLSRFDLYYEIGCGVDIYMPYFKFTPELKFGVGFFDIAISDQTEYTGAMKYLKSNIIMLSFHFE